MANSEINVQECLDKVMKSGAPKEEIKELLSDVIDALKNCDSKEDAIKALEDMKTNPEVLKKFVK